MLRDAGMTGNFENAKFDVKNEIFTDIDGKLSLSLESYTENEFRANYEQIGGGELNSKFVKIIFSCFTLNDICLPSPKSAH